MASVSKPSLSVAEYLAAERRAATRSEYLAGDVFAMAGASESHNLMVTNFVGELRARLKDTPCRVYPSDMRVRVPGGFYTYPDVSVTCGEPLFEDEQRDTLLAPVLLVEVLSETTEAYDRGKKFELYRGLSSLREYVLASPWEPRLERFRLENGAWVFAEAAGASAVLHLSSVECELPLAEMYAKVALPERPGFRRR